MSNIEGITSKNPFGNNDTIAKVNITQNGYLPIATFPNSGQYILSAYIKADKSTEIRFLMNETSEIQRINVSNSWKELEIPITANTNDELILRLPTNTYYLYNWKIEEGNKATTYTVAPEDTDEQIDELNVQYSEVIQTINSISATVGKHTTEIYNKADNSTVTEVKNQVSQLTLDLDGFRTEVSDTYTTKTESQQIQSNIDSVSDNLASFSNSISKEIEDLQNQLDGSITTWFYDGEPTLNNEPAVNWTTTEEKNTHIGDIYYDTITGYSYRFQIMNNQYVWHLLADSDVTKALEMASKAQDTADSKRRVFVDTPYPPYEVGDLWVGNTSSELMRCKTERLTGNYSSSDWEKAVKYTDDTTANAVKNNLETNYSTTTQMNSAISQSADGIKTTVSQQITETKSYADTVANNAKNSANSSTEEKLKSYSTTAQMNSAILQSANSIKTEVSSTYATKSSVTSDIKSAVNGIEIGGRNIFIGSSKYNDWYATSQTETDYIEVGSNREITVSLERRVASGAINRTYCTIYQYDSNKNGAGFIRTMVGAVTPIYLKDSITFKTDSSTAYIKLVFEPYTYYRHIKVEYGNKATDWTEAPEDVDENINSVRTVATQTADKFSWLVESGTSSSNFVLTDRTAELVAKIISLNGDVKVNGDMLVDGAVTAEKISVEDLGALKATIGGFGIADGYLWASKVLDDNYKTQLRLRTPKLITDSLFSIQKGKTEGENPSEYEYVFRITADGWLWMDKGSIYCENNAWINGFIKSEKYIWSKEGIRTDSNIESKGSIITDSMMKCVGTNEVLVSGGASNIIMHNNYDRKIYLRLDDSYFYITPHTSSGGFDTAHAMYMSPTTGAVSVASITNRSSKRFKENVSDITEDVANRLLDVDIVHFDYKPEYGDKDMYGVIAEDVINVHPNAVIVGADGLPEGVDYTRFIPLLIKKIQMQEKQINELTEKVNKLINQN